MKNGVQKIGSSAFLSCKSLKKITISKSVKFIGESAFEHCDKLKEIIFRTEDCTFFQGNSVIPENTVIFVGYQPSVIHEYHSSNKKYKKLKQFADNLVKNCTIDKLIVHVTF